MYLIVVAYTDVLHNHLHTDIQDCHQALQVGNSVTDHIWSTETGTGANGNRCTCMDGTLSAARTLRIEADKPSYVHLPLKLVLLYRV